MIRWGMIGCGAVTEVKSGPAFRHATGSALVAVASRRPEAARGYALRHGVPLAFDRIDELIASQHVDAVYIATPPASHLELALRVAAAGKPCCVEKPMAMNHAECVQMLDAFERAAVPLFVSYYRRSLPRFAQVKAWLDDGLIGEVHNVRWYLARAPSSRDRAREPHWRIDPAASPGGYFSDLASHGLDLFQHLLGDIDDAAGVASNRLRLYDAPDAVNACWRFARGALGSGRWDFGSDARQDTVEITGARGTIGFSVFDEAPLRLRVEGAERAVTIPNPAHIQLHHVENLVRQLVDGVPHPSPGAEAAKTSRVIDLILDAGVARGRG